MLNESQENSLKYINHRNFITLDTAQFGKQLTKMIAELWEDGETQELIYSAIHLSKQAIPVITPLSLNTLCALLFISNLIDLSKKIAKFNLKYFPSEKPQLFLISHLNLARIHYCQLNYKKCFIFVERALIKYEPYIFREMKNNSIKLHKNPSEVVLLLNGYLFYGKCVEQLQRLQEMLEADATKFFNNGLKLCRKYLPNSHFLIAHFSQHRKISFPRLPQRKIVNAKKVSIHCSALMRAIKVPQKTMPEVKIDLFDSGTKSSERVSSPRQFRQQSPKHPPVDIQNIIQTKFDSFVKSFNTRKSEPRIVALEKRITDLQRENLKMQSQRTERESEINDLKKRIEELGVQASKIREQDITDHDHIAFGNVISSNFNSTQVQFLPPPKTINRQSTTEIKHLIQTMSPGEQDLKLQIPDINLSNTMVDELEIVVIDQLDSGREYTIQLRNDITVIKKITINQQPQNVQCSMQNNILKIGLEQEKLLDLNALHNFLQVAEFKIALPYTCPLKCINNFNKFIQYMIIPFITIVDEQIQLSHMPNGLLQDQLWLFEEECQISLLPIEQNIFRLVITSQQQQCSIDLQFDQPSLDIFFEPFFEEECEKEAVYEMLRVIDQDEQPYQGKKTSYFVYSYTVKSYDRLIQFLQQVKQNIESVFTAIFNIEDLQAFFQLLNGHQISMPNNNPANVHMCAIKISELATFQQILVIAENTRENCFEILLQNCYETQAPHGRKVKAQGYGQCDYYSINKNLGLNPPFLDNSDLQLLCYFLTLMFDLRTFNKELDVDDYDRYRENCLVQCDINCESCCRFFVVAEYRAPVTISYLGIADRPIGVRIVAYDETNLTENGMFLTITSGIWDKVKKEVPQIMQVRLHYYKKKRKPPKYISVNKLTKDYHLTYILESFGWQIIFDNLSIENLQICRIINDNKTTFVDRLENVLNIFIKN